MFMLLKNTEHNIPTNYVLVTISSHNHFIAHHLHLHSIAIIGYQTCSLRRFYILNRLQLHWINGYPKNFIAYGRNPLFCRIAIIAYLGDWVWHEYAFPFASTLSLVSRFVFIGHVLFCKHQFCTKKSVVSNFLKKSMQSSFSSQNYMVLHCLFKPSLS